ncbi:LETM1 domain-containing protein [Lutibacter sp. B1]|jgi:hypothetical protein|uniref:LETM1 domain-containing protein n=1 Tax=Lutibacter sp. B1 TaxID=2725996 RepID=UPI0014565FA1|nr:LETM1 domain-containing protein [Lutibacter sp. B1]NLP56910.1 hypothetical protein [Lutibacter sp. B1]
MLQKKESSKLDLSVFENSSKDEFAQVIFKNKSKATKALTIFLIGIRNEAVDYKETSRIIFTFVAKQYITKEEEKHLKLQVYNLFKILGIGVPFVLIPGATLLIPFIIRVAEKKGIDLVPTNFKKKENF